MVVTLNPGDLLALSAAHQLWAGAQSQDREGARARSTTDVARPRRRGDRIAVLFCCGALGRDWHKAADRCGANVWTLFEVKCSREDDYEPCISSDSDGRGCRQRAVGDSG